MEGHNRSNETKVKRVIVSREAPEAIGPYSQAILVGDMLFCSGQIPINPATGELVRGSIETQTRQVLDNLGALLKEAGMDYRDVVSVTLFIEDMENFSRINQVYAEYFKEQPPARSTVGAARLPRGAALEVTLIAIKTH